MAILPVLRFPDERLRTKAAPVAEINDDIRAIVSDMFETMYEAPGIGLAATQVNVHKQVIVIDTSEEKNQPLCLINPEIIEEEGTEVCDEGCLSVPDIHEAVMRKPRIKVRYFDENWVQHEEWVEGVMARIMQHEYDHIDGKIFVDHLSSMRKITLRRRLADITEGKINPGYRMIFPKLKKARR